MGVSREPRVALRSGLAPCHTLTLSSRVSFTRLSIHKSQGQTLERVKVDLGGLFEAGQGYVALSRATTMVRRYRCGKALGFAFQELRLTASVATGRSASTAIQSKQVGFRGHGHPYAFGAP